MVCLGITKSINILNILNILIIINKGDEDALKQKTTPRRHKKSLIILINRQIREQIE